MDTNDPDQMGMSDSAWEGHPEANGLKPCSLRCILLWCFLFHFLAGADGVSLHLKRFKCAKNLLWPVSTCVSKGVGFIFLIILRAIVISGRNSFVTTWSMRPRMKHTRSSICQSFWVRHGLPSLYLVQMCRFLDPGGAARTARAPRWEILFGMIWLFSVRSASGWCIAVS